MCSMAARNTSAALTLILALILLGFGAADFLPPADEVRAKPAATTRAATPASSPVDPPPLLPENHQDSHCNLMLRMILMMM